MWEPRDMMPGQTGGTLNFGFVNPFPKGISANVFTYSTIFISRICDIDNTEIAERNQEKLERYLRKFEQELDAQFRGAASSSIYASDPVWRYGFK